MNCEEAINVNLLVGLGGLGSHAALQAGQLVSSEAGASSGCPLLVLGIDTDKTVQEVKGPRFYEGIFLPTEQFLAVRRRLSDYPCISSWLPNDLPEPDNGRGVIGSRALGRLAFYVNYSELKQKLTSIILSQRKPYMTGLNDTPTPLKLHVYIVSSLGGGTGAGILCDLAFLFQRIAQELKIPLLCDSILLISGESNEEMRASNVYSSLVELSHWMDQFTEYSIEPNIGEEWKENSAPFNRNYVQGVKSLRDEAELDILYGQVAAIVGLSVLPDQAEIGEKIDAYLAPYQESYDENENSTSFFSIGSSSIYLPTNNLIQIIDSGLAIHIIKDWVDSIIHNEVAEATFQGIELANEFISHFGLRPDELASELRHGIEQAKNKVYNVSQIISAFQSEQARMPVYGDKLVEKLETLDQHLKRLIVDKAVNQLIDFVSQETGARFTKCTEAVTNECMEFINARHKNCAILRAFISELDRQISSAINELHEALSRRYTAELSNGSYKDEAIARAKELNPNALQRFRGNFSKQPLTDALDAISDFYQNKIHILADKGAQQICFDTLQLLQELVNKLDSWQKYLENCVQELQLHNERCRERTFKRPGEALISQEEAKNIIEQYTTCDNSVEVIDEIIAGCGSSLFLLAETLKPHDWMDHILITVHRLNRLHETHVAQAFLQSYAKARTNDRLRLLFEQSKPELRFVPEAHSSEASYASLALISEKHQKAIDTIVGFIRAIKAEPPIEIVSPQASCSISIYRVVGGFALKDLELAACKNAYIRTLQLGMRYLHSRSDVKFNALARPSIEEITEVMEELAVGTHLGFIKQRPFDTYSPGADEIDVLCCSRLPDLSSLKACLRIYADPLEAVCVEKAFLSSLKRWRNEKLDELGLVSFLQTLQTNVNEMSFLGLELNSSLPSAKDTIERSFEEKWPAWSRDISLAVKKDPTVRTTDLVSIPMGARRWAMQRYISENPNENLTYHTTSGVLELVSAKDVENLDSLWMRLQAAREKDFTAFEESAKAIVEIFCQSIGFRANKKLSLGSLTGMQVEVHGLSIKLPSLMPVLVNRHKTIDDDDIASIRTILEQGGLDCRFCLLITAGDKQANIEIVNEQLRNLLRYDVIILTYEDIRGIIKVRSRIKALVQQIISQVNLTLISPFVTEGPVPASMFFGREGEIMDMLNRLDDSSVAVIGPRRVGKTSILQRVLATLRSKLRPVVYLDCQAVFNATVFLEALASEYTKDLSGLDYANPLSFKPILENIREQYSGAPVQFILDEVDWFMNEDPSGSEALFRMFKVANLEKTGHFLFCGERILLSKLRDPDSALYNFCNTIRIRFLEPADATLLITQPFAQMEIGWEDREASVKRILEATNGHPNIVQRACAMILEQLNAENTRLIKKDYVEGVLNDQCFIEEYLETLWGRATRLERIICLTLEEGQTTTPQEMRTTLQSKHEVEASAKEVVEALENLCLMGILEKQGSRYTIAAKYLPVILRACDYDIPGEIRLNREMMTNGG